MVKTQLHLKMSLLKTNLNTILETSLSLFQRNVLAQYVSKLFHTVFQHIGIAFLKKKKQSVRSFTVNVYKYLLSNENNI